MRSTELTLEQIDLIKSAYSAGLSIEQLRIQFRIGERRLKKMLQESGILLRTAREAICLSPISTRLTEADIQEIVKEYQSGISARQLCIKYKLRSTRLNHILLSAGIQSRNPSQACRNLAINETVFDVITEESAYWIGFLAADGSVTKRKGGSDQISITLKASDIDHLYKFRDFLKSEHKVSIFQKPKSFSGGDMCQFQFSSNRISQRLESFGITTKKSNTCQVIGLETNRHFWRGLVDGDGSISIPNCWKERKNPFLFTLCASEVMIGQFKEFISLNGIETDANPYEQHNIWHIHISSKPALKLIQLLYSDCTVALDRKLVSANTIMTE